ncbi:MAG: lytic transglycosylase domain-containing protein [Pseudomonadota bacterium]
MMAMMNGMPGRGDGRIWRGRVTVMRGLAPALRRMLAARAGLALSFAVMVVAVAPVAAALDLATLRSKGGVVRAALAAGESGDWSEAQALAARTGDVVVRDIVTWRKLRAGAGSVAEYQSFVARRGDWPGQEPLRRAVLGTREGPTSTRALTGQARENWRAFDRLYDRRDWDEAEVLLDRISRSAAALGVPGRWASRRLVLARRAARQGRPQLAYRLAANAYTSAEDGYDHADLHWVAGWVALRLLNDPATALRHFEAFAPLVNTPISNGRAGYWIGRAQEALGNVAAARSAYASAARWQTSFYGQLAAAKIDAPGDPALLGRPLPDWRPLISDGDDAVRMAAIVHYAGESALAWQVFRHLGETRTERDLEAIAALALDMEAPHYAVRMAKQAARRGIVIMPAYYPVTDLSAYVDRVEPAFAMSVARQETELNPAAISRVGARGLMQLMPATAQKVAGWLDIPYEPGRLTADWRYNATLGQTYLARRVGQLGGSYVLAAAAYNAGKGRVDNWVVDYGHPLYGQVDMIDWMEMIPFSETRNYAQRVMEGLYVYRTRIAGRAGPMTIEQDLARGMR